MITFLLLLAITGTMCAMEVEQNITEPEKEAKISVSKAKDIIFLNWAKQAYPSFKDRGLFECSIKVEEKDAKKSGYINYYFKGKEGICTVGSSFSLDRTLLPDDIIGSGMYELEKMIKAKSVTQDQLALLLLMSIEKAEGKKSMFWDEKKANLFSTLPESIQKAAEFDRDTYDLELENKKEEHQTSRGCSIL